MTINAHSKKGKRWLGKINRKSIRVIADGRDITTACFYYDGRRGIVKVYVCQDGTLAVRGTDPMKRYNRNTGEMLTKMYKPRRLKLTYEHN